MVEVLGRLHATGGESLLEIGCSSGYYSEVLAARGLERYAIFHRTPVLQKSATRHFTKDAYGVKTIEIHFNEKELVRLFAQNRLQAVDILTIDAGGRNGDAFAVKTYVCRKVPA